MGEKNSCPKRYLSHYTTAVNLLFKVVGGNEK